MKYFFLVPNEDKDPKGEATKRIRTYLEERGCVYKVRKPFCELSGEKGCTASGQTRSYKYTDPAQVPEKTQCVIVLGGDGTLIQAARDLADLAIPFIGVNLGTLGYLAELDIQSVEESLDALIEDKMVVQERMMVAGTLIRDGQVIEENIALNEVVLGRGGALNVIRFTVEVNGKFLNSYAADGVILSTPTGSTGYNLSAGGPILEPDSSMMLMTPISPHSMINRSIVFADTAEVEITLTKTGAAGALAAFDGNGCVVEVQDNDRIKIRKSEKKTKIMTLSKESFLEILRNKMSGE
ncbi:MAG: NAD(+)/NADH kinase [Lachnospiraceae bacterium]|nr:NAD(+)/NADH kinase [Lachnospiraceae bacterium]